MGVPNLEKAPGIPEPWLGIWRATLTRLREQGTWHVSQRKLLDEYVEALRTSHEHRELAREQPFTEGDGRSYIHPGFASADRERKAASALADQLALTPRARKALVLKIGDEEGEDDPFNDLADELEPRRNARAG